MRDDLAMLGISCARCSMEPMMTECLGCGQPPTREHPGDTDHWTGMEEHFKSPLAHVRAGEPAFVGLGYGQIVRDWPWCPLWYADKAGIKVRGERADLYFRRLRHYRDKGEMSSLLPAPWTDVTIGALDLLDVLESERERMRIEEIDRKRGAK